MRRKPGKKRGNKHTPGYTRWEKFGYILLYGIGIPLTLLVPPVSEFLSWFLNLGKTLALILAGLLASIALLIGILIIRGGWSERVVRNRFVDQSEKLRRWKERRRNIKSVRRAQRKSKRASRTLRRQNRKKQTVLGRSRTRAN